jgi:deoxyribodipyrimidine photo-lyase
MRVVHWFRNDLRLHDNTALAAGCARATALIPLFVIDPYLLAVHGGANRRRFLADCLTELADALARRGCPLVVRRGDPAAVVAALLAESRADLLTFNRDDTPYARRRDARVRAAAARMGARVEDYADRTVFAPDAIRTAADRPFHVYTPFRSRWWARFQADPPAIAAVPRIPRGAVLPDGLMRRERSAVSRMPAAKSRPADAPLAALAPADAAVAEVLPAGGETAARRRLGAFVAGGLRRYAADRDRPGIDGTSRLSPYLRFGAISARQCVATAWEHARHERAAAAGARRWIDELVWREFYIGLLAEHPRMLRGAFRSELANVAWNDDPSALSAWCAGRTGYPIVDAAMRQLTRRGWIHNRARMIAASFLTKDLLIDWRIGERFFMQHLVDGDPALNNGGWQWTASTGADAQPYFRIFNPVLQGERYDPDGVYVRGLVPELRMVPTRYIHRPWTAPVRPADYPPPLVDHAERRVAAIARYAHARTHAAPPLG